MDSCAAEKYMHPNISDLFGTIEVRKPQKY
jgi:hypothetical protein